MMDFFERLEIEKRLRTIDESWGDATMSDEEAAATKEEHDALWRQLHPEAQQTDDAE
jgi:hypothetical protein